MKALEALEELKFQIGNITFHTRDLQITTTKVRDSGLFETIEKSLKALEIIKTKYVNISRISRRKHEDYNYLTKWFGCEDEQLLTKEEYELLKEVLL